ncbi:hypothetical protein KP509_02G076700 [Ceratopteris richardii]|uniref:RIN4 pathogenic type III effector avirulence factor Avr cleavage site domain-containing protein n=1 Tax=Ceratopteris richardii TaxID=49495 RepID=A0A8T2VAZ6_CERRI|nr:hypothetical protein KP509_02G076700 [Ceratopteris richardii]KAH7444390.1 hypothetical protein KP509_02G076700 [Ceratopteris richardii]
MAANHIPKFGNWDSKDEVPYTMVFDSARAGKGGLKINPNDPTEYEAFFGKPSDAMSVNSEASADSVPKATSWHQRRASREDSEMNRNTRFNHGHGQNGNRTEEDHHFQPENGSSLVSGVSPMNPQPHRGQLGRKPGTASPSAERKSDGGAPGTPNRNRPERYASPLPKFGEWDVNNPASGEGYTIIFDNARDQKKTGGVVQSQNFPAKQEYVPPKGQHGNHEIKKRFWNCFRSSTAD